MSIAEQIRAFCRAAKTGRPVDYTFLLDLAGEVERIEAAHRGLLQYVSDPMSTTGDAQTGTDHLKPGVVLASKAEPSVGEMAALRWPLGDAGRQEIRDVVAAEVSALLSRSRGLET